MPDTTPPALRTALDSMGAKFNPSTARDEYTKNQPLWQLYLDLLEADKCKIESLLEKHHDAEDNEKFKIRKALAGVLNLIPSIVRMIQGYVFSEEPEVDLKNDPDLEKFFNNCDSNGLPFSEYERQRVLPLALAMGMTDVLVQNPAPKFEIRTAADAQAAKASPAVYTVTPLDRINWSTQANGVYNWVCFKDSTSEDPNPLQRNIALDDSFITIAAANGDVSGDAEHGFWIRSTKPRSGNWIHEAGFTPTKRCSIASFFYQQSIDPARRHFGISKIAIMAVLTKLIIQILSWTTEDILSNLAILALPTKGGQIPKDEEGNEKIKELTALTILAYDKDAKNTPMVVQGAVDHIRVKMELIDMLVREILRLAHMMGASAEAEKVTSGVQGVVMRTELHQELSGIATGLDAFAMDVFALVKSLATGQDWTHETLIEKGISVNHWKGPYGLDPIADVIANAQSVIDMFREVSPTTVEAAYKQTARSYLYAGSPVLEKSIDEITKNTKAVVADQVKHEQLVNQATLDAAVAAGKAPPGEGG